MDRIGPSAQLGAQALVAGTILGVLLGLIAAVFHNGFLDYTSTIIAVNRYLHPQLRIRRYFTILFCELH